MVLEGTIHTARGERQMSAQLQTPQSIMVIHLYNMLVQSWHKSCGSNQPLPDWI